MTQPSPAVLDASALLAYLQEEKGGELVLDSLVAGAHISAVNWAEVLTKLAEKGRGPLEVTSQLEDLGILGTGLIIEPFDAESARVVATLREPTRQAGLSLGDRACLALGSKLGLPVLTADGAWLELDLEFTIKAIR